MWNFHFTNEFETFLHLKCYFQVSKWHVKFLYRHYPTMNLKSTLIHGAYINHWQLKCKIFYTRSTKEKAYLQCQSPKLKESSKVLLVIFFQKNSNIPKFLFAVYKIIVIIIVLSKSLLKSNVISYWSNLQVLAWFIYSRMSFWI